MQDYIGNIRAAYKKDFTSKDITKQQIAVATYLIDKLALRAGNEKVLCLYMYLLTLISDRLQITLFTITWTDTRGPDTHTQMHTLLEK